jgi:hypothetical protein
LLLMKVYPCLFCFCLILLKFIYVDWQCCNEERKLSMPHFHSLRLGILAKASLMRYVL